jgi:3-hydroxybutyryl-CoA dehydratase
MNNYQWHDLSVGLKHQFQASITEQLMAHFLLDSGDCNPLHVDAAYAEKHGFKGRVAYGLLTSSFYSTLVGIHLPGKFCLLHGIDIAFISPVYISDQLTVSGEITYLNDAYQQAQISAEIVNISGEMVSKAKIKVGILPEQRTPL